MHDSHYPCHVTFNQCEKIICKNSYESTLKSFLSEINALQMLLKGGKNDKIHFFKWTHSYRCFF